MSQEIMLIAGCPDNNTRVRNTLANLSTLSGSMIKHCQLIEISVLVSVETSLVMHFLFKLFSQNDLSLIMTGDHYYYCYYILIKLYRTSLLNTC